MVDGRSVLVLIQGRLELRASLGRDGFGDEEEEIFMCGRCLRLDTKSRFSDRVLSTCEVLIWIAC